MLSFTPTEVYNRLWTYEAEAVSEEPEAAAVEEPEAAAVEASEAAAEEPEAAPPAAAPVESALEVADELALESEPLAAEVLLLLLLLTQEESPSWMVTGDEYWIEPLASVILKVMEVPASISAFQVTWVPDSLSEMVSRAAADDWPPGITALQNKQVSYSDQNWLLVSKRRGNDKDKDPAADATAVHLSINL